MKDRLLNLVQNLPCDYAEVRIQNSSGTTVRYSGHDLEDIGEKTGLGGCVRVLAGGGWGFVTFNDLENVERFARRALDQAQLIGGSKIELAPVTPSEGSYRNPVDTDPADVPLVDKQQMCARYKDIILSNDRIQTGSVLYRESSSHKLFVSSDGACIEQHYTFCGIMMSAIAVDGSNVQTAFETCGDLRGFDKVTGREELCEEIVRRALQSLEATPVDAGVYDVILDPVLCGVFVHEAFGHLSESDFVYENPRLQEKMTIGRRFGEDILNITDDGSLQGNAGFIAYDDEGTPGSRSELVKDGILVGRLHNRETAARMGERPTGHARAISYHHPPIVRMTNTFMESGENTFEEMLQATPDGIYAVSALGGQTNMEMFTFSPQEAWRIRDGRIAEKLRDVVLSGNVFQTLASIDMIGNDLTIFGSLGGCGKGGQSPLRVGDGGPHCRIRNVVIGGR